MADLLVRSTDRVVERKLRILANECDDQRRSDRSNLLALWTYILADTLWTTGEVSRRAVEEKLRIDARALSRPFDSGLFDQAWRHVEKVNNGG